MRREPANDATRRWEGEDGVRFLRAVGVKPEDTLVDFGCRAGHYTIPAARLVGASGQVYAIDKDRDALDRLMAKVRSLGFGNVQAIETSGRSDIDMESDSVDVLLLYDVLHYFTPEQRCDLLHEARRVLVPGGLLSVYPKHTAGDWPSREFTELNVTDVAREIEACSFHRTGGYEGLMSHDDTVIQGRVLNFRKPRVKR